MRNKNNFIIPVFAIILAQFLLSCNSSLEMVKRKYSSGYYIAFSGKKEKVPPVADYDIFSSIEKATRQVTPEEETTTACINNLLISHLPHPSGHSIKVIDHIPSQKFVGHKRSKSSKTLKRSLRKIPIQNYSPPPDPEKTTSVLGIVSFVLGIYSVIGSFMFLSPTPFLGILAFPAALLALLFGAFANKQVSENPEIYNHPWLGQIGLILGLIVSGIFVLLVLLFLLLILFLILALA